MDCTTRTGTTPTGKQVTRSLLVAALTCSILRITPTNDIWDALVRLVRGYTRRFAELGIEGDIVRSLTLAEWSPVLDQTFVMWGALDDTTPPTHVRILTLRNGVLGSTVVQIPAMDPDAIHLMTSRRSIGYTWYLQPTLIDGTITLRQVNLVCEEMLCHVEAAEFIEDDSSPGEWAALMYLVDMWSKKMIFFSFDFLIKKTRKMKHVVGNCWMYVSRMRGRTGMCYPRAIHWLLFWACIHTQKSVSNWKMKCEEIFI